MARRPRAVSLNLRFPGQGFQAETGLHYNWHRSYDPTLGRYTEPDPLGFVDDPSVHGYADHSPQIFVDPDGQKVEVCCKSIDIDWAPPFVSHCWLKTDTKEAEMVGQCPDPGNRSSDKPFIQTKIIDHTGLNRDKRNSCTTSIKIDEDCVNKELVIGKPTGETVQRLVADYQKRAVDPAVFCRWSQDATVEPPKAKPPVIDPSDLNKREKDLQKARGKG